VGDSLEAVKQKVNELSLFPKNKLLTLLKQVTSSSTQPTLGSPEFLFDNIASSANAWHSAQQPEFPQWIDIEFQQPVTLEKLGFQAQIGEGNQNRAPREVMVLGGQDLEAAEYRAALQFQLDQAGAWSFQQLPETAQK
jgi:hypothetical protein